MPRFYFDVDDGERADIDDTGSELESAKQARDEAIGVLPDIARDVLPDGGNRVFVATVRDETGREIFRATLSLTSEWLSAP